MLPFRENSSLSFAVNTRAAGWTGPGTPYFVSLGSTTLFTESIAPVNAAPYFQRYVVFQAPAASGDLRWTATSNSGDRTLLLDNVRLIPGNADPGNVAVPLSSSVFAGNALRLTWPATAPAGMRLQSSRTMLSGSWLDVTVPAVIEGPDYTIYEPMDDARRFYQLLKP